MKIAYVVSMFPCWSETFILNELVCLKNDGLDIDIFSLKQCSENLCHEEAKPFVESTYYPLSLLNPRLYLLHLGLLIRKPSTCITILGKLLGGIRNPAVLFKGLLVYLLCPYFVSNARRLGTEYLHAHFATYPALLAWMVGKFSCIPFSFTAHAHDIYVDASILRIIYDDADSIVTISEYNKQFIRKIVGGEHDEKVHVIHCGIDIDKFQYAESPDFAADRSNPVSILSIGRLSGIKGFPYLIAALGRLRDMGISFNCHIIGDGPMRGELQESVHRLGLDGQVVFHGAKNGDEIRRFIRESDLFVLACARDKKEGHDGIPVVFMEAMAMGTPVVGTRISGIPELVKHGITGYCAETEDPESLANCLREAMDDMQERTSIVQNARTLVEEEFNIALNCNALNDIFQTRIGGK